MADDLAVKDGTGAAKTMRATEISSDLLISHVVPSVADGTPWSIGAGAVDAGTVRITWASDAPGSATLGQATMANSLPVVMASDQSAFATLPAGGTTVSTDVTRPADTTAYAANDAWSDSTTAPTSGGFTLTGMGRSSGGSGIITDAVITTSGDLATLMQGEIWLFDTAVTNINDNAAFAVSDAEIKTYVGKIPFVMEDAGNNGAAHLTGLNLAYTCVSTANLRFLVRVKNAYTPVSAEVLTVRLKIIYTS